jgi:hypothetical protein
VHNEVEIVEGLETVVINDDSLQIDDRTPLAHDGITIVRSQS